MKNYYQFIFEKIISPETLLDTIKSKLVSSIDILDIDISKFNNLETLFIDDKFNDKLNLNGYKKETLELTKEYETFLKYSLNINYFLIFKENQNELERPKFIIIQSKKDNNWGKIEMYQVNDDMKKFYDQLTNKTIKITQNNMEYIYKTSNGGNDWVLQNNIENQSNSFKRIMKSEEIDNILKINGTNIEEID